MTPMIFSENKFYITYSDALPLNILYALDLENKISHCASDRNRILECRNYFKRIECFEIFVVTLDETVFGDLCAVLNSE